MPPPPLDENQIAIRGIALLLAVVLTFAVCAGLCVGAGLLGGALVLGFLGWRLLGGALTPTHLRVATGIAFAGALVTIWAS